MDNVEEEGDRQCQVNMILTDTEREMTHWTIHIGVKVSILLVPPMKTMTTPMGHYLMMIFTSEGENTPLGQVNMVLAYTDREMTHWTIHIGVVSILLFPLIKMITTPAAHYLMMIFTSEGENTPLGLATKLSTLEPSGEPNPVCPTAFLLLPAAAETLPDTKVDRLMAEAGGVLELPKDRMSVTLKTQIHLRETHSLTEDATSNNSSILVLCQMIMRMQEPTEAVNVIAAVVAAATNTHSLHHGDPAHIQHIASIWTVNAVTIMKEVDIVQRIKVILV